MSTRIPPAQVPAPRHRFRLQPRGEPRDTQLFDVFDDAVKPPKKLGMVRMTTEQVAYYRDSLIPSNTNRPIPVNFERFMRERVLDNPAGYSTKPVGGVLLSSLPMADRWEAAAAMWQARLAATPGYPT